MATISDSWSGVVNDLKATKDELKALKEGDQEKYEKLIINQGQLSHKYNHLLNILKGVESTLHTQVVSLENKKAEAIKMKFSALEEQLECQEDAISNLKDEVAYLRSVRCCYGEPACVTTLEVGELEYLDDEV